MTIYPHLDSIVEALETLSYPVFVAASLDTINNQVNPAIHVVPEDLEIQQIIGDNKSIHALRMRQVWVILLVLHDPNDQFVGDVLLKQLGEDQAAILNVLCRRIVNSGGPMQILDVPKPTTYQGGFVAGQIRIGCQFQFVAE